MKTIDVISHEKICYPSVAYPIQEMLAHLKRRKKEEEKRRRKKEKKKKKKEEKKEKCIKLTEKATYEGQLLKS